MSGFRDNTMGSLKQGLRDNLVPFIANPFIPQLPGGSKTTDEALFGKPKEQEPIPAAREPDRSPVLPDVTRDALAALAKRRGRAGTILTGPNSSNTLGAPGGEGGSVERKTLLGL